jgi:hypothetical protein
MGGRNRIFAEPEINILVIFINFQGKVCDFTGGNSAKTTFPK